MQTWHFSVTVSNAVKGMTTFHTILRMGKFNLSTFSFYFLSTISIAFSAQTSVQDLQSNTLFIFNPKFCYPLKIKHGFSEQRFKASLA